MKSRILAAAAVLAAASAAGAYLVGNAFRGPEVVLERVPDSRLPLSIHVDTEPVPGVPDPLAAVRDLMGAWNDVPGSRVVFGDAFADQPCHAANIGSAFGAFTNARHEIVWDADGDVMRHFGVDGTVLGITIKSVNPETGAILDLLVVVNTDPALLSHPSRPIRAPARPLVDR